VLTIIFINNINFSKIIKMIIIKLKNIIIIKINYKNNNLII